MKTRIIIFLMLCLSGLCINKHIFSVQKAVINVPIADLLGNQITQTYRDIQPEDVYKNIAVCAAQIDSALACPRLHQLLYNDIVEIIKMDQNEACIKISHAFYLTPLSSIPQTIYWTLKKNVTPLETITAHNIEANHIPEPINFSDSQHTALNHVNIITLKEPHYDKKLKVNFSVGTRFIQVTSSTIKQCSMIKVFAIDYSNMKEHQIQIPRKKCTIYDTTKTHNQRITDYVALLKKWAHTKQGCIPYVWGGTSFTGTTLGFFKEVTQSTSNGDYSFYQYDKDTTAPKNGFDCSGLIARAAQINGIPYFCKNTTTIPHCLTPLQKEQKITAGDLILIRGHVMAVSDVEKNLLIEARSYTHGYGKLHEIPISQVFDGILTYHDLLNAYHNKIVVKRKDKLGKIRDTFANIQLFSMTSAWDKKL